MATRYDTMTIDQLRATERRLLAALATTRVANREQVRRWWLDCYYTLLVATGEVQA